MRIRYVLFSLLLTAGLLAAFPVSAAYQIHLKATGITGEATATAHKDEIVVLSWDWGLNRPTSATGSGTATGRANFRDLKVTKYLDRSSPLLMLKVANGNTIAQVVLTVESDGGTPFLKITLNDVIVTQVSGAGSAGSARPTEDVTFSFASIKVEYSPPSGNAVMFTWDREQNQPL